MNYVELMGSREVTRNTNSYSASRTFLVYEDSGTLTLEDAVNYENGVSFSDQHPDISGIFANGFSIKASGTRADTWELSWTYAAPVDETDAGGDDDEWADDTDNTDTDDDDVFDPPSGGGGDDGGGGGGGGGDQGDDGTGEQDGDGDEDAPERLFTGVSLTTGLALVDGFVAGATLPVGGTQGGDDGYLITDGTIVHQGGEPVTVPVPTTDISLSITEFRETYDLNNVQLKAGKRNNAPFYGFGKGSVIFKGMSVQRQTENSWDITYNFVWDAWSHMRQVPKRTEDGDADWNDVDPPTLDIYYKQPFPDTTSFAFSP